MEMGSGLLVMRRSRFRFPEAALTKTAAKSTTARCRHPRHRSNVRKMSPKCPEGWRSIQKVWLPLNCRRRCEPRTLRPVRQTKNCP
jgi:hypothetical protein